MITLGQTGDYIKSLKRAALLKTARNGALTAVPAAGAVFTLQDISLEQGATFVLPIALAGVAAFFFSAAKKSWKQYERASIGLRSEQRVAAILARSGVQAVVHGAMLGAGGDADHIVLGPGCAVIETKTGKGRVQVRQDGFFVGRRKVPKDPIGQARRQAAALGRKTGVYAQAIVCVVDMEGQPFQTGGVWVCSAKDLTRVIASLPAVLQEPQAVQLAKALSS